MKKNRTSRVKPLLSFFTFFLLMIINQVNAYASFAPEAFIPEDLEEDNMYSSYSKAFLLFDLASQTPIMSLNKDTAIGIASLTKLMTLCIVLDEMDLGHLKPTDLVTISRNAQRQEGDGLKLRAGDKIKIDDLIKGMLICSSNDAATALAEHISGTESKFVQLMNKKAQELGLNTVHFFNSSGLSKYDNQKNLLASQNVMSPSDLMHLTQYLINNYPEILAITNQEEWFFEAKNIKKNNTNTLLKTTPEINGFKTGFTYYAGYCQVTTAKLVIDKVDQSVIHSITGRVAPENATVDVGAIVLGASTKFKKVRLSESMIHYAKEHCSIYVLSDSNIPILKSDSLSDANFDIYPEESIQMLYKDNSTIQYAITINPLWARSTLLVDQLRVGNIAFYEGNHFIKSIHLILKKN